MNLREGIRRLALLLGVIGAFVIGWTIAGFAHPHTSGGGTAHPCSPSVNVREARTTKDVRSLKPVQNR